MKKVISKKNLPTKSPIQATVVYALAMDYWNAPQWLLGATGLLLCLIWVGWVISFFNEEGVDILNVKVEISDNGTGGKKKSRFQERLKDEMSKK